MSRTAKTFDAVHLQWHYKRPRHTVNMGMNSQPKTPITGEGIDCASAVVMKLKQQDVQSDDGDGDGDGDGEAYLKGYPREAPGFGPSDISVLTLPGGLPALRRALSPPSAAPSPA